MSKPLDFQEKGARVLSKILEKYRSAFLADEAGLGKTYTSTILIRMLAEKKFNEYEKNDKPYEPFKVLYVCNSKALVEMN